MNRRTFIKAAALGGAGLALGPDALNALDHSSKQEVPARFRDMQSELGEELNSYRDVTTYNNFYEFGTGKDDPHKNSGDFRPRPWTVKIDGHVNKPGDYQLEDFLAPHTMEDRVYRLRCVEGWSMVIPWYGFPLADLVKRVEPTGNARYLEFTTVVRPSEMPGQRTGVLDWPYVEGLRRGHASPDSRLYGMDLPNQNGAPLRLVVPWKYGFKGIKSIVRIRFVEEMPHSSRPRATTAAKPATRWGARAAAPGALQEPRNADVQRVHGRGAAPLRRHGSQSLVLSRASRPLFR